MLLRSARGPASPGGRPHHWTSAFRRPVFSSLPALFLGILFVGGCGSADPGPEPTRVVLITLDTLRYESVFGPPAAATMPKLRSWAENATVFDRCYSASASTQPTHASLLTGLHPWEHGVTGNAQLMPPDVPTIAELLRRAGYSTDAIVASFPLVSGFGFDRGFERYDDRFDQGTVRGEWLKALSERLDTEEPIGDTADPFYSLGGSISARAQELLRRPRQGNQFYWFHYFDAHSPYGDASGAESTTSPKEALDLAWQGKDPGPEAVKAKRLYDSDTRALDDSLSRLLSELDHGAAKTHIAIVADHGESFGEHGSMGHGRRLIESQIRVPCLIRSPDLAPGGRTDVVGSVDFAATLLAFAGVEPEVPLSGRDLALPPPETRAVGMRRTYERPHRDRRLDGTMILIDDLLFFATDGDGVVRRGNAEGLRPLKGEPPPSAAEEDELTAWFASVQELLKDPRPDHTLEPDVEKAMKALGYVP